MTDQIVFGLGLFVMIITCTAVLLVGRDEAQDPAHNRNVEGPDGV